jgi:hypothetical protein
VGGNLVEELLDAGHMVAQLVHWQDPVQNQVRLTAQTRGSYLKGLYYEISEMLTKIDRSWP